MQDDKPVKFLVVDSSAFIRNAPLKVQDENLLIYKSLFKNINGSIKGFDKFCLYN